MEQEQLKLKYKHDKLSIWGGVITLFFVVAIFISLYILNQGTYLLAWIFSIAVALLFLCSLSIPRYILIGEHALEIRCVVEMTRIQIDEISVIRKINRKEYDGKLWCVLGSFGFFGYYGYYLNTKQWKFIKVYATERQNLVEIEDVYEQKYIVSCRDRNTLIEGVMQAKLKR